MNMKYEIKRIEEQTKEIQRVIGEFREELQKYDDIKTIKSEVVNELSKDDLADKYYCFVEMNTNEIVPKFEALDYVLAKLGIELHYNNNKEETKDFLLELVDWYFSGNWVEELLEDSDL